MKIETKPEITNLDQECICQEDSLRNQEIEEKNIPNQISR